MAVLHLLIVPMCSKSSTTQKIFFPVVFTRFHLNVQSNFKFPVARAGAARRLDNSGQQVLAN